MFRKPAFPADFMIKNKNDAFRTSKVGGLRANYASSFVGDDIQPNSSQEFSFFGSTENAFDLFGPASNLTYGLIDLDGDVVVPKTGALRPFSSKGTTGVGVDFAVRAFDDLKDNFSTEGGNRKEIKIEGTPYEGFNVMKSYVDLDTEHSKILEDVYVGFMAPDLRNNNKDAKIKNFHDFLNYFLYDFYPNIMFPESIMLCRSNFALSNKCSKLISGLIFEISLENHQLDYQKYQYYVASRKYDVVKDGAANFGFMIDRNAPWRFVANLNSPKMLKYIRGEQVAAGEVIPTRFKKNGAPLEIEDTFPFYYEKVYLRDILVIKKLILNLYNYHINRRSYSTKPVLESCDVTSPDDYKYVSKLEFRDSYTLEKLNQAYGDDFWLFEYLKVRLTEVGIKLNSERLLKQKQKLSSIRKYLGYTEALTYLNSYVKGFNNDLTSGKIRTINDYSINRAKQPQITGAAKAIILPEE